MRPDSGPAARSIVGRKYFLHCNLWHNLDLPIDVRIRRVRELAGALVRQFQGRRNSLLPGRLQAGFGTYYQIEKERSPTNSKHQFTTKVSCGCPHLEGHIRCPLPTHARRSTTHAASLTGKAHAAPHSPVRM